MSGEGARVIELKTRRCAGPAAQHGPFLIDEHAQTVECGTCGEVLSPVSVLAHILRWEGRIKDKLEEFRRETRVARMLNQTRCEHCGELGRIVK